MVAVKGAGDLRDRVHLQRRSDADDGFGNMIEGAGPYVTQYTVWANLRGLVGSEPVQSARLAGRQPFVVTVRQSSQSRQVTSDWQIVDARNADRVFAISAPPIDPDGSRAWLEILAVEGRLS